MNFKPQMIKYLRQVYGQKLDSVKIEKRPASKSHTFPEFENIEQGKGVGAPVLVASGSLLGAPD